MVLISAISYHHHLIDAVKADAVNFGNGIGNGSGRFIDVLLGLRREAQTEYRKEDCKNVFHDQFY